MNAYTQYVEQSGSEVECSHLVQAEKEAEFAVRGRIDIIADILRQTKHGAKKTRVMYSCNLSFRQLRVYLNFLVRKGFLSSNSVAENPGSVMFMTTERGLDFLEAYDSLQAVISS
jgi:predicted transcriptional regulator